MSLKTTYNNIASGYSTAADRFGSISLSHESAIHQITSAHFNAPPDNILDFGVGTGVFLQKLHLHFPKSHFTGIDISDEMLKHAKTTLPSLRTIETSAAKASQVLPHSSQDLVLAHFINAYMPIHLLFNQANLLTSPGGHFSLMTTTYDSFHNGQQQLEEFCSLKSPLSRIVRHYYSAVVKNTTVAKNEHELMQTFANHHFEVIDHQRLKIPIILNTMDEVFLFGIEGAWFLNGLPSSFLPERFARALCQFILRKIITFPYQDTHVIDVVLSKKVRNSQPF